MSNIESYQNKVIRIKPIEVPKEEAEPSESDEIRKQSQKVKDELQRIIKQKEILINETKATIENEKENWVNEKQQLIKKAKEEGYRTGFSLGKEESLEQYEQLLKKANSITESAINDYHSTIEKSENTILTLSVHAAEKIIKQKFTEDPTLFLSIVRAAIKELKDQSVISIYVHPNNYEFVLQQKDELIHILENDTKLSIYINDELDENSCLIQHPFGQIDAGIDTQLQQLRSVLHEIAMESNQ